MHIYFNIYVIYFTMWFIFLCQIKKYIKCVFLRILFYNNINIINNKIVNEINFQYIDYDIYIWKRMSFWTNLIIFANISLIIITINSNFIIHYFKKTYF